MLFFTVLLASIVHAAAPQMAAGSFHTVRIKTKGASKAVHQSPEQIFEQFCQSMLVCIGQGRFIGSLTDSQMFEFSLATGQTTADFAQ